MAETRKTKELNLLEDKPELLDKKTSLKEPPVSDHEVYNKQNSDSKKNQNKFMKSWHNNKKFRIGIIVGIVIILGLSLGLGLGLGLKNKSGHSWGHGANGEIYKPGNDGKDWIEDMSNTSENDIRDLENAAIIWALDQEVALGVINPSDASAAQSKAKKKADRQIADEKKAHKNKNEEDWDTYLQGLGYDNEEEYYNSKIADSLISTSNVVDGLTDFDDTTENIDPNQRDGYEFVSSGPKTYGSSEGDYLAITSNTYSEGSPNITETLMKLYLNIAKPVYFQQESTSYTLSSNGNPGTNPNEWETMRFSDNTQIESAYVMANKLDNAATTGFYDSGNSDTPIISPTKSGIKHFTSLPTDLTTLAYYYATVDDTNNIEVAGENKGLQELGDKANQVLLDTGVIIESDIHDGIVDDGTFDDTNITETDRINISNEVFKGTTTSTAGTDVSITKGLSNNSLYKTDKERTLGKTITWDSEDKNNSNANIKNEYLLTTDETSFTLTRMENPNYVEVDETGEENISYDLYTVGKNMVESDLEKELNGKDESSYLGVNNYGIWDDFELWVNTNAKALALNWALTAEGSTFLTKTDFDDDDINYHIDIMDDFTESKNETDGDIHISEKGQSLLNYYYSEFVVNQEKVFNDKFSAADDFYDDNDEIYVPFIKQDTDGNWDGNGTVTSLINEFTYFQNINEISGTYFLTSFNDLLNPSKTNKGGVK